jgi:hypothetical protein
VSDLLAQLQEPTPFRVKPGEVRFFPSGKGGTYKARALPYIDRVTVLARLNEVLGEGWRSDFQVIDTVAKVVQCRLEIRTPEGWIGRADIGGPGEPGESPTTEWKSAATDALKRAAVQFGLGRFLSGIEVWVPCEGKNKRSPVFVEWIDDPTHAVRQALRMQPAAVPTPVAKNDAMERLRLAQIERHLETADVVAYCRVRFNGVADPRELQREQLEALICEIQAGQAVPS